MYVGLEHFSFLCYKGPHWSVMLVLKPKSTFLERPTNVLAPFVETKLMKFMKGCRVLSTTDIQSETLNKRDTELKESTHPFLSVTQLRITVGLEPILPAIEGAEGYTLDMLTARRRANTEKQTTSHTYVHTYCQFTIMN